MSCEVNRRCEDCKRAKFWRKLSRGQEINQAIASLCISSCDPQTKKRGWEISEEIVTQFCKIGKMNVYNDCEHWERKWWKWWIEK